MVGEWRKQKNLTLQQLAENAGVSAAYISQIEHSKASPSIATLKNLARALDRPVVDFFIDELVNDPVVMHEDQWTQVNMPEWKANVRQLVRDRREQVYAAFLYGNRTGRREPEELHASGGGVRLRSGRGTDVDRQGGRLQGRGHDVLLLFIAGAPLLAQLRREEVPGDLGGLSAFVVREE